MAPDDVRCPSCRGINWHRDGFAMTLAEDGGVLRQRIGPSSLAPSSWACRTCLEAVPDDSELGARLTEAMVTHED